jgi:predicted O-methyltransferase YrrM
MGEWLGRNLHTDTIRIRMRGIPRRPRELWVALRLLGELRELGWQQSFRPSYPIDRRGNPCPWMNYAAIGILDGLVSSDTRVFEYGSGASTAWLAARSDHVHAVEHDPNWFDRVQSLPGADRADVRQIACCGDELEAPDGDAYVAAPGTVAEPRQFDIIIIDGWARLSCLAIAPGFLAPRGIVVLDDAERESYAAARRRLVEETGYRELTVQGPKPAVAYLSATSFFIPPSD